MSNVQTHQRTWLTQEAYDRLRADLERMTGEERDAVVGRIESAREEGDLRENGGYHAAKEEQGKLEARIRQVTELLREVVVGEPPATGGVAGQGSVVTIDYGSGDTERFLVASRENATEEGGKLGDLEVFSPESPIGQAIFGHRVGDVVEFGPRNVKVTIVDVQPYRG